MIFNDSSMAHRLFESLFCFVNVTLMLPLQILSFSYQQVDCDSVTGDRQYDISLKRNDIMFLFLNLLPST